MENTTKERLVPREWGSSVAWEHSLVEKLRHPQQDVGFGLYASASSGAAGPVIAAGETVYRVVARTHAIAEGGKASRGSLQMGSDVHVNSEGWTWAFLNHSCAPNVRLHSVAVVRDSDTLLPTEVDFTLTALTDIGAGQELTFNYLTTEEAMAAPFACACGAAACFRTIRGLTHADTSDAGRLRALEPLIAPHLADLLAAKIKLATTTASTTTTAV
jgi:hypothetical protein